MSVYVIAIGLTVSLVSVGVKMTWLNTFSRFLPECMILPANVVGVGMCFPARLEFGCDSVRYFCSSVVAFVFVVWLLFFPDVYNGNGYRCGFGRYWCWVLGRMTQRSYPILPANLSNEMSSVMGISIWTIVLGSLSNHSWGRTDSDMAFHVSENLGKCYIP